jgi:hypothetical protein
VTPRQGTQLLTALQSCVAFMPAHQRERARGQLLIEATAEIHRLIRLAEHVHDRLLRGESDAVLLAALETAWKGEAQP